MYCSTLSTKNGNTCNRTPLRSVIDRWCLFTFLTKMIILILRAVNKSFHDSDWL